MPRLLLPVLVLTIVFAGGWASDVLGVQAPSHSDRGGEVPLPFSGDSVQTPVGAKAQSAWDSFRKENPGWTASWNARTKTPHRAFGSGIAVSGPVTSKSQATSSAREFLDRFNGLTKARGVDLQSTATLKGGRVWYAHFQQRHQGIPVMLGDITVRLGEDGKVFAFGSDIRTDIALDVTPRFDAAAVRLAAREGLDIDDAIDEIVGGEDLYVLPLEHADRTEYRLVRRVEVMQSNPPHRWVTYVDAHTAEVVWRFDRVRYGQVSGSVSSSVHLVLPTDPLESDPNVDTYVNVDGTNVTTDALGEYLANDLTGTANLVFELSGPWAQAFRQDGGSNARVEMTVDADTDPVGDHHWDNTNSHSNERDAYHATVRTHNYIKDIDPGFTNMDIAMPVNVLLDGSCNAFWNGVSINFFRGGNGCQSTAKMVDVVAHEYGHAISDLLYQQAGAANGMTNGALQEGHGRRDRRLPDRRPGGGQRILPGRRRRPAQRGQHQRYSRRHHQQHPYERGRSSAVPSGICARPSGWRPPSGWPTSHAYGTPDHPTNLRQAYREYLIEVLIADDDDSDLANETPNWDAIITAFGVHGVTPSLFVRFEYEVLPDTDNTDDPIVVEAQISSDSDTFPLDAGSVRMTYRINRDTPVTVPMTSAGEDMWTASIPAQPEGTIVSYWFEASIFGEARFRPALFDSRPNQFYVGTPTVVYEDDFETDPGLDGRTARRRCHDGSMGTRRTRSHLRLQLGCAGAIADRIRPHARRRHLLLRDRRRRGQRPG